MAAWTVLFVEQEPAEPIARIAVLCWQTGWSVDACPKTRCSFRHVIEVHPVEEVAWRWFRRSVRCAGRNQLP
ncbi:hypothetical protein GCM10009646_34940 [Streptomyces aureus]